MIIAALLSFALLAQDQGPVHGLTGGYIPIVAAPNGVTQTDASNDPIFPYVEVRIQFAATYGPGDVPAHGVALQLLEPGESVPRLDGTTTTETDARVLLTGKHHKECPTLTNDGKVFYTYETVAEPAGPYTIVVVAIEKENDQKYHVSVGTGSATVIRKSIGSDPVARLLQPSLRDRL
jgi:hypothetical protein